MDLKFKRADFGERWSHCGEYLVLGPGGRNIRYTVYHKATVNRATGMLWVDHAERLGHFQTVDEAKSAAQSHLDSLRGATK